MLDVVCTHCGKTLKIPEKYIGQRGKCSHCQGEITVKRGPDCIRERCRSISNQDLLKAPGQDFTADMFEAEESRDIREPPPVPEQGPLTLGCPKCRTAMIPVQKKRLFSAASIIGCLVILAGMIITFFASASCVLIFSNARSDAVFFSASAEVAIFGMIVAIFGLLIAALADDTMTVMVCPRCGERGNSL